MSPHIFWAFKTYTMMPINTFIWGLLNAFVFLLLKSLQENIFLHSINTLFSLLGPFVHVCGVCLCCVWGGDLLLSKGQQHWGIESVTWRLNSTAVITKLFSIVVALKRLELLTSGTSLSKTFQPLGRKKKLLFRKWTKL